MALLAPLKTMDLNSDAGLVPRVDRRPWQPVLLLAIYCAMLFFPALGAGPLFRNEGLRAILAQSMLTSGDWVVPHLYGQPIYTKPPGMYWLIALCSWPAGEVTAWTARLPSALAATVLVFLFFWHVRRHVGSRDALAAGVLLPMSLLWLDKAPSAEIDLVQTAWVAAAILFFARAAETRSLHSGFTLAAFTCLAGGVLTKWTAPAFFYLTVIPWLYWRGEWKTLLSGRHLLGLAWAILLVLSWLVSVAAQQGWSDLLATVAREGQQRLLPGRRAYPWLESLAHPLRFLVASLPWSPLALLTLRPSFFHRWNPREQRLLLLFHAWTWTNLIFWSLATEHHMRNSLPIAPGLAGLTYMVWLDWRRRGFAFMKLRPASVLILALVLWLPMQTMVAALVIPHRASRHHPRASAEWLKSLIPVDKVLYLFKLKDETLMFYYGRSILRLAAPAQLPAGALVILTIQEYQDWQHGGEILGHGHDSQGDGIVLLQMQ